MTLPSLHLVVLPIALLLAVPAVATAPDRGCPVRSDVTAGQPEWMLLENGQVVATDNWDYDLTTKTIVYVQVLCYPTAERMFGLSVQRGVTSVMTTPGPMDGFHEGLEELVRRQNEHFAAHRRYASELAELPDFQVPQHTTIDLTSTAAGWTATVRHAMVSRVCHAYGGAVAKPHENMAPDTPKCFSEHKHMR